MTDVIEMHLKLLFDLDNLIADGKAKPMIVVAPFGHTVEPGTHGWPFVREQGDFVQDFIEVLIPYLIKHYRMSKDPKKRALAGYSMGGYHTLKIGLNNQNQFGNLGPFSWGGSKKFFTEHAPHVLNHPKGKLSSLKFNGPVSNSKKPEHQYFFPVHGLKE